MKIKVPPITLTAVSMSNFRSEVLKEKLPVLLGCLHHGLTYKQQLGTVEQIALRYGAALKVCLAAQEDLDAIGDAYHTTGTPAFLFFRQGKEIGRLLGQADEAGLMAFIDQVKVS
jgi:hypothetical protein